VPDVASLSVSVTMDTTADAERLEGFASVMHGVAVAMCGATPSVSNAIATAAAFEAGITKGIQDACGHLAPIIREIEARADAEARPKRRKRRR
jgi:hypothetical protein